MRSLALAPQIRISPQPLLTVERFLRDRESVWQQIGREEQLDALIKEMLLSSALALAWYGAVIGL